MVDYKKDTKEEVVIDWVMAFGLVLYLGVVSYLVFSFLFSGGAFENPANIEKFWTYVILGIVSSFVMFIAKLENFMTVFFGFRKTLPKNVTNFLNFFDVFIHEPRYSVINKIAGKRVWW